MTEYASLTAKTTKTRVSQSRSPADEGRVVDVGNWLDTLPVAAAIYAHEKDIAQTVSHNQLFANLGLNTAGAKTPHNSELASYMDIVARKPGKVRVFNWASKDPVSRRRLDITVAEHTSREGKDCYFLIYFVDRTAESETQMNLRREMMSDSLTGLANRSGFEEQVEQIVDSRLKEIDPESSAPQFAVLAVDLARFSQINECAGSIVGDELIISVASRLRGTIRKSDLLARIGGNEFGIFVELRPGKDETPALIARIESVFANPYRLSDLEMQVDAAIGVATGTMGQGEASETIRHAQSAMKHAKKTKNTGIYAPEVLARARRRFTMETDLRKALDRDELHLEFQPLIDLSTGSVSSYEALARWHHPDRGIISPVDFIPVAEESGLIIPLGRWALHKSAETLALWDSQNGRELPVKMNVNLSAVQFTRDDIAEVVEQAIRHAHIAGNRMTLELTESVIVTDPDRAAKVMKELKLLDASLAMDDFGTGYSNLACLQKLPIDILKIDRSFVTKMLKDKDKVAIVRAVLSLADALGMQTTAEGIESVELSQTLAALGCSHGQGFYYAHPMPSNKAYAYYKERLLLS